MSIISDTLSSLSNGTQVKITNSNGQIIQGIIVSNDGKNSVAVQVSMTSVIKYDAISSIEIFDSLQRSSVPASYISGKAAFADENSETAVSPKSSETKNVHKKLPSVKLGISNEYLLEYWIDEEEIDKIYSAFNQELQNVFASSYQKLKESIDSGEENAKLGAVASMTAFSNRYNLQNNPAVNNFIAVSAFVTGQYKTASEYFYYSNNLRSAYLSAYRAAYILDDNIDLYIMAAVFSAIDLSAGYSSHMEEAASCMQMASVKCKDMTGIEYLIENSADDYVEAYVVEILKKINNKTKSKIVDYSLPIECVKIIKEKFTYSSIKGKIAEYKELKEQIFKRIIADESINISAAGLSENTTEKIADTVGKIIYYNIFESRGQIEGRSGTIYSFEISDISDASLSGQLKKLTKTLKKTDTPIAVQFVCDGTSSKPSVSKIKRTNTTNSSVAAFSGSKSPKTFFENKEYEEALVGYEKMLSTKDWEEGVIGIVYCCLALCKKESGSEQKYTEKLAKISNEYYKKLSRTVKNYEVMNQAFTKLLDYEKVLYTTNILMDLCEDTDHGRMLHYLYGKARCYKNLGDYESAISQLLSWCDIEKKYHLEKRNILENTIYIELAELYLKTENYDEAKRYVEMSAYSTKREELRDKIRTIINENKENSEGFDETSDTEDYTEETDEKVSEEEMESEEEDDEDSVIEALLQYSDANAFDNLGINDLNVIETINSFNQEQLYCLIAYLSAAAKMAKDSVSERKSDLLETSANESVQFISNLFNYAYDNPMSKDNISISEINFNADFADIMIPQISGNLFISALIRTAFNNNGVQIYELDEMVKHLDKLELPEYVRYIKTLFDTLYDFRIRTGLGIDMFADYNTKNTVLNQIVENAKELMYSVVKRTEMYESQGRVRRTRSLIFSDEENSELYEALKTVCDNDKSKLSKVKKKISDLFMRNENSFSPDNIDIRKLDDFMDSYWVKAREHMIAEGRHLERFHDNLKGGKRTGIENSIRKVISCICDWVAASESANLIDESYFNNEYNTCKGLIIEVLGQIIGIFKEIIENSGFDWGVYSVLYTAEELLAKMNGTYNPLTKKYLFINFLRDGNVLLDEEYLPDIYSTFSDLSDMNILQRIKAHSKNKLPTFAERINQISQDNISSANFRSAKLIEDYAKSIPDDEALQKELGELSGIYKDCVKTSAKRAKGLYEDFRNELELFESYGSISDLSGRKTAIQNSVHAWYKICSVTCDFGFFANLINSYKNSIAADTEAIAERLIHQLNDIVNNPEFEFGVYSKEQVMAYIEDRNFSVAENILNCIRRHDVKTITDFTVEPYGFFSRFISEYSTLYRTVSGANTSMRNSIIKNYGKNDINLILRQITNNPRKDVKGGNGIIQNWIAASPAGTERIEKFLNLMEFNNITVTKDTSLPNEDCYSVSVQKQSGRINYSHPIPAFGSAAEEEGFRVLCLYGRFDTDRLIDKFRSINFVSKHTIVLLDFALNLEERRRLARKIKEEEIFSKTFIVIDRVLAFYLAKHYQKNTISRALMATTMPFAYYQPFCPTPNVQMPPELFTGRKKELISIESADGANIVYGGRQLGKSALLKMAEHDIDKNPNGDRAIVVNIHKLNCEQSAELVSRKLIINDILPEGSECSDWETLTMRIEKRLKDDSPETRINYFLLMLDEADEFIECSRKINYRPITALKELLSKRFKFVLAGLHNLSKFNYEAVYYNNSVIAHLDAIVIRPFQRPEATELLTNVLAYLGFRFKDEVISHILAKTNYFPGLIHLYGQKLLEAMKNEYAGYNEINTPYYEVTESHIKKVLSDMNFKSEINGKLRMTLYLNSDENENKVEIENVQTDEEKKGPYYPIALILAYMYFDKPSKDGYTKEEILTVADLYGISKLTSMKDEQFTELLHEMWDLNIISVNGDYYMFSTDGFRELLGRREKIEEELNKYAEGEAV